VSTTGPGNQTHGEDIIYKEALNMLHINVDHLDSDPLEELWTIRENQQEVINNMAYSMFGDEKRSVTPRLTKDALMKAESDYSPDILPAPSQKRRGSVDDQATTKLTSITAATK
jgi:hypothetical protein